MPVALVVVLGVALRVVTAFTVYAVLVYTSALPAWIAFPVSSNDVGAHLSFGVVGFCVRQALSACECLSASMWPGVFVRVVSSRCQRRQKMSAVSPENPAASECAPR